MTDTPKVPAHLDPNSFVFMWHEHFDKDIRDHARKIAYHLPEFRRLIIQAKTEGLHKLLGFKSWPAYVADVVGKEMTKLPVDDRRQIIAVLSGEGMSQRAIADAVGVSQSTVRDDVAEVSRNYSPASDAKTITDPASATVTGLDDKSYPKKKPAKKAPAKKTAPKTAPEPASAVDPIDLDHEPAPLRPIDTLVAELESVVKSVAVELERHVGHRDEHPGPESWYAPYPWKQFWYAPCSWEIDPRKIREHPFTAGSCKTVEGFAERLQAIAERLGYAETLREDWAGMTREQKLRYIGELENEEPHEEYKAMLQAREVERIRRLQEEARCELQQKVKAGQADELDREQLNRLQKIAADDRRKPIG